MSIASLSFKMVSTLHDKKRDKDLEPDPSVAAHYDIRYGKSKKYNRLDVYYPKGTRKKLPVIVNFHGGGYVYGTKQTYLHYGMFMASQGFVFVNPSYHLAPRKKYPTQLEELNQVMAWMARHQNDYYMDVDNVFIVGDSAGAQLALQYATLYSNPEYEQLFSFQLAKGYRLRGVALNCGMYNIYEKMASFDKKDKKDADIELVVLLNDYLGKDWREHEKQLAIKDYIGKAFPPAFVMTAEHDFLRDEALPMVEALNQRGVDVTYKKYGEEGEKQYSHIFHCNLNLDEAKETNREQCSFFKSLIR